MNNLICQQLFLLLLKYGKVSKEEKDIYLYGIEIILEKAENLFFVFIIIYMYKKWIEGLLFIAIYSILRKTGGGYHAKTSGGCILFTIAIVNVFFQLLYSTLFKPEMELFMLFSLSFIYIIAPVDCRNNPLIGKPKKNYLFVILMIILCVYWGMIMINKELRIVQGIDVGEKMINISICDDCEEDALRIKRIIEKQYQNTVKIDIFLKGKYLLESKKYFDIVFLDIELTDENGIDIGNRLKEKFYQTIIIYVTSYSSYYSDAFSVHAYQYILKPFEEYEIKKVLDEAIGQVTKMQSQNTICLDVNNEIVVLVLRDIIYFEFVERKVKVVTKNGDKYLRISLKTIYERVKEYNFGMPHKAFLVNFYYVKGIKNNEIVLENQKNIPIAQKRAAKFRKEFFDFLHKVYYVL